MKKKKKKPLNNRKQKASHRKSIRIGKAQKKRKKGMTDRDSRPLVKTLARTKMNMVEVREIKGIVHQEIILLRKIIMERDFPKLESN